MALIPTRLLILIRMQSLLRGITPANGYGFDLSGEQSVFRGRILLGAEIKPLPVLSLLEAARPDAAAYFMGEWNDTRDEKWTILIQGVIEDDPIKPTDSAYYLEAAVEKRLSLISETTQHGTPVDEVNFMLGGLINEMEIGPPVVRPPEDKISATAFMFLPVRVGLARPIGNPYTTI